MEHAVYKVEGLRGAQSSPEDAVDLALLIGGAAFAGIAALIAVLLAVVRRKRAAA